MAGRPEVRSFDRRAVLRVGGSLLLGFFGMRALDPGSLWAFAEVIHPDPRPGITAAKVLADEAVREKHRDAYRAAREIPEVLDGLFCHCDCARVKGMRSLLSCFESDMPTSCGICLGEARLALRLHRQGKSLADIRVAVDAQYGRSGKAHSHQ